MQPMDDEEQGGLVDQKALQEIITRATDALRPIGLTLLEGGVQAMVDPQSGAMMLSFAAQIRPKAAVEVVEDLDARKEFNRMQAQNHDKMIEDKAQHIRDLLKANAGDADALSVEETISAETCPKTGQAHKLHPSTGHCLECGFGLDS